MDKEVAKMQIDRPKKSLMVTFTKKLNEKEKETLIEEVKGRNTGGTLIKIFFSFDDEAIKVITDDIEDLKELFQKIILFSMKRKTKYSAVFEIVVSLSLDNDDVYSDSFEFMNQFLSIDVGNAKVINIASKFIYNEDDYACFINMDINNNNKIDITASDTIDPESDLEDIYNKLNTNIHKIIKY